MPTSLAIRRRRRLWSKGIGMPGDNNVVLRVARRLTQLLDLPVIGGVAVALHGYARSTVDVDLYTSDVADTDRRLRAAGARWIAARREYLFDDVRVQLVTPDVTRHVIGRVSVIDGVRVASLRDLIAMKLRSGLAHRGRLKDLADVQELIRAVPLDKAFAAKLPKDLRADYRELVDAVRGDQRHRRS